MEYTRALDLRSLATKKSLFLFGPRSTGKTYLIKKQLGDSALILNLLETSLFLRLSQNPAELEDIILENRKDKSIVVIDEVQRVPQLLSEVHRLLDKKMGPFLLTGSSARRLKTENADMLAGRAWVAHLHSLTRGEIPRFSLERYLLNGGLPQVYASHDPSEELAAYVDTYLRQEIMAEGLIRKLAPFSRFLKVAALSNGQLINFANISNDTGVPASTIKEYFSILEDTLIGFLLEPWIASKKRKAIQTAKFYFFDTGVTHMLAGTKHLDRNSNLYGTSFEHFIGMELRAYLSYHRIRDPLTFWRSTSGYEVDFLIGDKIAIEVKSGVRVAEKMLRGLKALGEEGVIKKSFLVSQDRINSRKNGVHVLHWEEFLNRLWAGEIVT